jgi:hypothetical protein
LSKKEINIIKERSEIKRDLRKECIITDFQRQMVPYAPVDQSSAAY